MRGVGHLHRLALRTLRLVLNAAEQGRAGAGGHAHGGRQEHGNGQSRWHIVVFTA